MTTLEQLTKAIQALVPEIMELKFGCRVNVIWGDLIVTGKRFEGFWIVDWSGQVTTDTWIKESSIVEILGRPITLFDCLMAMSYDLEYMRIDNMGGKFSMQKEYDENDVGMQWNWHLPLSDQSPETIDWLAGVICKDV